MMKAVGRVTWLTILAVACLCTSSPANGQDFRPHPESPTDSDSAEVSYNVTCSPKWMIVTVTVNSTTALLYLDRLKNYAACSPSKTADSHVFRLPLDDIYTCGTTRMLNKLTGTRIFYHRVVVEEPAQEEKDIRVILVTCSIPPGHNATTTASAGRNRRNSLPDNFVEPESVNISGFVRASAPVPYLSIAVQQAGHTLDTTKGVQPGTPLHMIVYLDRESAGTYGLLTSFLKVTDGSPEQEEVIIMNGCSIDPYIFGNFESPSGEGSSSLISAKFRAFKFPDADHVLFVGTVSVCLQECKGVPCGGNELGYGRRRRRSVPTDLPPDPNRMFEVEMTTVLKVQYSTAPHRGSLMRGSWSPARQTHFAEPPLALRQAPSENSAPSPRIHLSLLLLLLLAVIL